MKAADLIQAKNEKGELVTIVKSQISGAIAEGTGKIKVLLNGGHAVIITWDMNNLLNNL